MTFSNNPEKLSLFGGGCNENDRILDLYGGLSVQTPDCKSTHDNLRPFWTGIATHCDWLHAQFVVTYILSWVVFSVSWKLRVNNAINGFSAKESNANGLSRMKPFRSTFRFKNGVRLSTVESTKGCEKKKDWFRAWLSLGCRPDNSVTGTKKGTICAFEHSLVLSNNRTHYFEH